MVDGFSKVVELCKFDLRQDNCMDSLKLIEQHWHSTSAGWTDIPNTARTTVQIILQVVDICSPISFLPFTRIHLTTYTSAHFSHLFFRASYFT